MITVSRRRLVLGAVCAALVAMPAVAGWSTGRSLRPAAAPPVPAGPSPVTAVPTIEPPFSPPATPSPIPTPTPTEATLPADMGEPVGWRLGDVPRFPPRPAPEPITLPPGDEAPFLSRIPVTQPVAFLTIDDGVLKNPEATKLFAAAGIPVTLFLTTDFIQDDIPFFDRLRTYGAVIEAHTISHPDLAGKWEGFQRHQICDGADRLGQWYGRRPVLFRPPFGDKDRTTLRVAKECGLRAAFMWKETVDKGIVRYQDRPKRVQPGDIILMHFRPAFVQDFLAALRAIHRSGLTPARLEDYVPTGDPPSPIGHPPGVQNQD